MSSPSSLPSPLRRREVLDALRRGTVPQQGLEALAVGLDGLLPTLKEELGAVAAGSAAMKALRGDYGSGKTFFARFFQDHARRARFATAEVQISETETPLHRIETVYRRLIERLATAATPQAALRSLVDEFCFRLEEEVLARGEVQESDSAALVEATNGLIEQRLGEVSRSAPLFGAALRGYRSALLAGDEATAIGLLAWLGGQPNVAAGVKRQAGIKGDVDHFGALSFLQGLLALLRDTGYGGLVLVLDELETLQRMRGDTREKALNALRQLIDEIDGGRFPGLYLLITGTPAFFDGPSGIRRLAPLAARLHVDFSGEARFDNPRAVQIRLPAFTFESLLEVGRRTRELFLVDAAAPERIRERVDDACIAQLARSLAGSLGGKVGVAPRLFLKKLVAELLDRVELHADFDPRRHYRPTLAESELTEAERQARSPREGAGPDDIVLELPENGRR